MSPGTHTQTLPLILQKTFGELGQVLRLPEEPVIVADQRMRSVNGGMGTEAIKTPGGHGYVATIRCATTVKRLTLLRHCPLRHRVGSVTGVAATKIVDTKIARYAGVVDNAGLESVPKCLCVAGRGKTKTKDDTQCDEIRGGKQCRRAGLSLVIAQAGENSRCCSNMPSPFVFMRFFCNLTAACSEHPRQCADDGSGFLSQDQPRISL